MVWRWCDGWKRVERCRRQRRRHSWFLLLHSVWRPALAFTHLKGCSHVPRRWYRCRRFGYYTIGDRIDAIKRDLRGGVAFLGKQCRGCRSVRVKGWRRRWWCRRRRGPYEHARPRRYRAPSRMHTAHKMATCAKSADPSAHTALYLRRHTHLAASAASGLTHCGSGGRDGGGSLTSRAARQPTGGKC